MKYKNIVLFIMLFVFCLFMTCLQTNYDYDFFARIIVGERFIEQGILPFQDFLSYTPTHPWYDHEWGSGVVFYLCLKYLGSFGIILLQALLVFGISYFVIKIQRLQKHSYPTSIIFMALFVALINHLNTLIRCQLFSFLFFSMFLYFLEKSRKQNSKLIWFIPFIIVVWNNLHGGVVSGLGLIVMYIVGALIERKPFKRYIGVLALSTPLLAINPYGIKYLDFLFSAATKHRKYIVEWWPFYKSRHILYYIFPSLYGIFASILGVISKNKNITKKIVLLTTLCLGLAHVKLLSLTVIAASALCYNEIAGLFLRLKIIIRKIEKSAYAAILALALLIPFSSPNYARVDLSKFPLYEVEFLLINNIEGNIVVPFGLGSYISYKLYPNNKIFMDGRYEEVYNDKEFDVLMNYELAEENWEDIVNNYKTDILMPRKEIDIYRVLKNNPNWVHIFDGRMCGIFVKKGYEKFSYFEPEYNVDYYKKTVFCSKTFGKNLKKRRIKKND